MLTLLLVLLATVRVELHSYLVAATSVVRTALQLSCRHQAKHSLCHRVRWDCLTVSARNVLELISFLFTFRWEEVLWLTKFSSLINEGKFWSQMCSVAQSLHCFRCWFHDFQWWCTLPGCAWYSFTSNYGMHAEKELYMKFCWWYQVGNSCY